MSGQTFTISASDLTFLLNGCPRCFVLKVKHGIQRPSMPLPPVFTMLAGLQKRRYAGLRTEQICPTIAGGKVVYGERPVRSSPLPVPDLGVSVVLQGRFDMVIELDDGTYGVIDCKMGNPTPEKSVTYQRQLLAYAYALEHPEQRATSVPRVSTIGLLYFVPADLAVRDDSTQSLVGQTVWIPLEKDYGYLEQTVRQAACLLSGDLPESAPDCPWCQHGDLYLQYAPSGGSVVSDGIVPPLCPRCGGPMRLRDGRYGRFWGCRNYPDCRGTVDLM